MAEVPKLTQAELLSEVVRLNVVATEENRQTHPLHELIVQMREEHPLIENWGVHISTNMPIGMSRYPKYSGIEGMVFDNSYIAAYGLIRFSYLKAEKPVPFAPIPEDYEPILEERRFGSQQDLLERLGDNMHKLDKEYPDFLQATEQYATHRIPNHGAGFTLAATAIAAAEMYYSFVEL
jgi:hypothetical protein